MADGVTLKPQYLGRDAKGDYLFIVSPQRYADICAVVGKVKKRGR